MKDALAINMEESDTDDNEITLLRKEIAELKAMLTPAASGTAPRQTKDAENGADKIVNDLLEPYTEEQIEKAERWILKEIGGRLKIKQGPDGAPEIECNNMVVTKAHRDKGVTNLPDGFRIINSVPVRVFAAFYMPVILDDSGQYQNETERLLAVIEYSRTNGKKRKGKKNHPLHPELEYLFKNDGTTLKDKGRRNRNRHKGA